MESYGAAMVIVWILGIILALMALLMPVYVYQIRNKTLAMDKKLGTIIELLDNTACPFCGAPNKSKNTKCIKCGKAMGL